MLRVTGEVILGFSVVMEVVILFVMLLSALALKRAEFRRKYGRVEDMLSSDTTPPVSIIMPAYNEEAGIVDAVRSMTLMQYPRFEIIVVNDGSQDGTLAALIDAFRMEHVVAPYRSEIPTAHVRGVYRSSLPIPLIVVDKENGGRADANNTGINLARHPYVLVTDADIIIDPNALLLAMRRVVEDRVRVVAVGGNIRPINGNLVGRGRVTKPHLPATDIERVQVLEYIRSFVGSRPGWSALNALPLISGAFGIFRRDVLVEVGGSVPGHLGEDLDMTLRMHRHLRRRRQPYRMVYAPDAVAWTEVPSTNAVLRRQRIRWHRGLLAVVRDNLSVVGNPRYGMLGLLSWPYMVLFEFVAPIIEFCGWFLIPLGLIGGYLPWDVALLLFLLAYLVGAINSLMALILDEAYGFFNSPLEALRLIRLVFIENFGLRQKTVWWRIRALFGGASTRSWGDMQRRGVAKMAA